MVSIYAAMIALHIRYMIRLNFVSRSMLALLPKWPLKRKCDDLVITLKFFFDQKHENESEFFLLLYS